MKTQVIATFPGTGKSYYVSKLNTSEKVVDLDSSVYTRGHSVSGKANNPDFPGNYLAAIDQSIGRCSVLFVSTHPVVVSSLIEKGVEITLVYPDRELKQEYIDRFRRRGSSESFMLPLSNNWDAFLERLEGQRGCQHVVLRHNQYVSDVISRHEQIAGEL